MRNSIARLTTRAELPEEPPSEFPIFMPGHNPSTKGDTLWDRKAAESVMAAYRKHGVDIMIDLEHHSVDAPHARADSADARGWFQPELRADGSLWAVNVRWTPDGERRLRERTQRFTSPAFYHDKSGRPVRLLNVALCAMPATDRAAPLMAASELAANKRVAAIRMLALACSLPVRHNSVSAHKAYRSTRNSNGSRTDQKGPRAARNR